MRAGPAARERAEAQAGAEAARTAALLQEFRRDLAGALFTAALAERELRFEAAERFLRASERERELWRVALPAPATPEPSASPTSTASPGATAEPSPPATEAPVAGGGTSPWKLGLAGLAVAAAVGVGIVAARRLRT